MLRQGRNLKKGKKKRLSLNKQRVFIAQLISGWLGSGNFTTSAQRFPAPDANNEFLLKKAEEKKEGKGEKSVSPIVRGTG